jgi:hypothetical protein
MSVKKLLLPLLCFCSIIAGLSQSAAAQTKAVTGPILQILQPRQLGANVEIFNSASGLYDEVIQTRKDLNFQLPNPKYTDFAPLAGTPVNLYGRLSWHSLEPTEGRYDFSILDNVLQPCPAARDAPCLPKGGRFGFRIMPLNPQVNSDTNLTTGSDGYPVYADVPAYLETAEHGWLLPVDPEDKTQGHYFIPDWNDHFFLDRVDALLHALGNRYNGDPRLGWIDIGLYGSWGEWHTAGLPDQADYKGAIPYAATDKYYSLNTQAWAENHGGQAGAYQAGLSVSKNRIIDAHLNAFPDTQLLMLTADGDGVCHALASSENVGLRRDSLGANDFTYQFPTALPGCDTKADQEKILSRWMTAPFIVEPYGNGSSPTFPCQTFTPSSTTGDYELYGQVAQYHVAAVKNASFCTGPWSALSTPEQQAVLWTGVHAGYRLAPVSISVKSLPQPGQLARLLFLTTSWANTGVTPAYDPWSVTFSLWTSGAEADQKEIASFASGIDLRKVLPTGSGTFGFSDSIELPGDLASGQYELRITVADPAGYMLPMQLALQGAHADGSYSLGMLTIE